MNLRSVIPSFLLLAAFALPAHADRDAVQFFSNIDVPEGSSVHDAVCFFCSVNAKGNIDHDVVVFFGNVHIGAHSDHDVVNFFGTTRLDDNASVAHDMVNFFGSIHMGENATVGNDVVAMFGSLRMAETASIGGNRVSQPAALFWVPLLILCGIIVLIVNQVRTYRRRQLYAAAYPFPPPPPPPQQPRPPQTSSSIQIAGSNSPAIPECNWSEFNWPL